MNKRKVILRADGNTTIGLGHVMRSLALANMLKKHFHCVFAIRSPSTFVKEEIAKVCHGILALPDGDEHFNHFLAILEGGEIVVLDNYYFDTAYQRRVKEAGCVLVCIDDLQDKHFLADVIINPALGVDVQLYKCEKYTKIITGFKFALLRQAFLDIARMSLNVGELVFQNKKEVVIYAGGGLAQKLFLEIISFCESISEIAKIHLIANERMNVDNLKKVVLYGGVSENGLLEVFSKATFGILPSSTIAIEACAARVPFITGYFIDNQVNIYNGLVEAGVAIGTGNWGQVKLEDIDRAIKKIVDPGVRTALVENQINQLDGSSDERIIDVFLSLS